MITRIRIDPVFCRLPSVSISDTYTEIVSPEKIFLGRYYFIFSGFKVFNVLKVLNDLKVFKDTNGFKVVKESRYGGHYFWRK